MADKVCLSCKSSKDRNVVGLPVWNNRQRLVHLKRYNMIMDGEA